MAKRKKNINNAFLSLSDKHIDKLKENSTEIENILQALINAQSKMTIADKLALEEVINKHTSVDKEIIDFINGDK